MRSALAFEIVSWVVLVLAVPSIVWLGWRTYWTEKARDPLAAVHPTKPANPLMNFGLGVFLLAIAAFAIIFDVLPNRDLEARLFLAGSFALMGLVGVLHLVIGTMTVRRRRMAKTRSMAA